MKMTLAKRSARAKKRAPIISQPAGFEPPQHPEAMKAEAYVGMRYYAFNVERAKDVALDAYELSLLLIEEVRRVTR